jgi:hypothetical protein
MEIRPATREDFLAFYKKNPPFASRAIAAIKDNTVVGIGGYYLKDGLAIAFTDNSTAMTKRDIVQACGAFRELIGRLKIEIIAQCSPETGTTLMRHFGFEPCRDDVWRLAK